MRALSFCTTVADVGAVEGADEVACFLQIQALGDLALGRRVGGGGERDPRDLRPALVQYGQLAVFRAEVVACDTQWASSMANRAIWLRDSSDRKRPVSSRSGA